MLALIVWQRFAPSGELARGIAVLAAGFAFFVAGLAVNWLLRRGSASDPGAPRTS